MSWARFFLHRPVIVAMLMLCALGVRLVVPTGFMPVAGAGGVSLQLCPGTMPAPAIPAPPMAGMHHGGGAHHEAPARPELPCAFSGVAMPAIGSAAPDLIVAALAFVFLLAIRGVPLALPLAPARLRPPLRAPPLPA